MRRLSWLLTLPLAVVVVVFAIHNRAPVSIDLWPAYRPVSVPLYLVVLGAVVLGFLAGALVQWVAGGKRRQQARRSNRRLTELEREAAATGSDAAHPLTPAETGLLTAAER